MTGGCFLPSPGVWLKIAEEIGRIGVPAIEQPPG